MKLFVVLLLVGLTARTYADKDDKKWVWNGNGRSSNGGRDFNGGGSQPKSYDIYEENDYRPLSPLGGNYFPPNLPNQRPPQINERPIFENRPAFPGTGFVPNGRPGGVYNNVNNNNNPTYGGSGPYIPEGETPSILTGPVPSWVREGPFKNVDKCKCTEKFNCNSPGFSYGHCDAGKQYCCYTTKGAAGGPVPSKPVHSIENGVLVGPGGPVDRYPGVNRPPKQLGGGFYRPGSFQGGPQRPGGFFDGRPENFGGVRGEQNEYSPENGILVGPGGPFDAPGPAYAQGRSASSTKKP